MFYVDLDSYSCSVSCQTYFTVYLFEIIYRYSRRIIVRNFIWSIGPFVLACFPQAFTDAFANRQLVRFECQFDQLSVHASAALAWARKPNRGLEPGSFYLSDRKKCKVRKQLNKSIHREGSRLVARTLGHLRGTDRTPDLIISWMGWRSTSQEQSARCFENSVKVNQQFINFMHVKQKQNVYGDIFKEDLQTYNILQYENGSWANALLLGF